MRAFTIIFLFMTFMSNAQKPEIVSIKSTDRMLRGSIGDDFAITLYLKVARTSENVGYVHSVKGWYKYNKIGIPIPLVGIWTGSELDLFASNDRKFMHNLLNFTYENKDGKQYLDNHLYELESFTANFPEVIERFHLQFEEHQIAGTWKRKGDELKVSIISNSSQIVKEVNYLKLPNGKYFDLSNLGIPGRATFDIIAAGNNNKNFLLEYSYQANLNYNGRCGGAETSGKVSLAFNPSYQLSNSMDVLFMNCYKDVSIKEEKISETVIHYKIYDYDSEKEDIYAIDTQNATIKKVKN